MRHINRANIQKKEFPCTDIYVIRKYTSMKPRIDAAVGWHVSHDCPYFFSWKVIKWRWILYDSLWQSSTNILMQRKKKSQFSIVFVHIKPNYVIAHTLTHTAMEIPRNWILNWGFSSLCLKTVIKCQVECTHHIYCAFDTVCYYYMTHSRRYS